MKQDRGALRVPPPLCPPFFLLRGYPTSAKLAVGRHFAAHRMFDEVG